MSGRTRPCDRRTIAGRLAKAEQFLAAAATIRDFAGDEDAVGDAYVTLCIHAGVAAADVICCVDLGVHALGEHHTEAVALLAKARPDGVPLSSSLRTLLAMKTLAGYSAAPVRPEDQSAVSVTPSGSFGAHASGARAARREAAAYDQCVRVELSGSGYTPGMKTAVSIPDELFRRADEFATRAGKSRSQLYREALDDYLAVRDPAAVTRALDELADELALDHHGFVSEAARRNLSASEW
jgi:predicted transcriptional regulator